MKRKILKTALSVLAAISGICALSINEDTAFINQILWSGGWVIVMLASCKALEKLELIEK